MQACHYHSTHVGAPLCNHIVDYLLTGSVFLPKNAMAIEACSLSTVQFSKAKFVHFVLLMILKLQPSGLLVFKSTKKRFSGSTRIVVFSNFIYLYNNTFNSN